MSKIYDFFLKYADKLLGGDVDTRVKAGIECYLKEHQIYDIDDESDAEFEMLMFTQMSPAVFKAFFVHYAERNIMEQLSEQAKVYAIHRAINGETLSQDQYQPLLQQLLDVAARLSKDEKNKQWLKPKLDATLMNFKFAAGLSSEVSEEVARALCKG